VELYSLSIHLTHSLVAVEADVVVADAAAAADADRKLMMLACLN
jgi:hypothetical protein